MMAHPLVVLGVALPLLALASVAHGRLAVSANDNKVFNDNGTVKVVPQCPPDTVSVIDFKASPPRVVAEVNAPVSVVGPPLSIALTPDESLAIVTASNKVDPADSSKQAPDNRVTVIDAKTLLVGNMIEKDFWVFQWDGTTLKDTGQRVKVNGGPAAVRTADK